MNNSSEICVRRTVALRGTVPLSVLIPVRNEEDNIADCIRSVAWAEDIVVVDSASSDRTCAIAVELGARVVQFHYTAGGPKKKNWALRHADFRHSWILILDADERVPPQLGREISEALATATPEVCGFYINRRLRFMGRWIRHCGYFPSWNLRLLRRGAGEYEMIPDTFGGSGDNEVHEHIMLNGRHAFLKAPLDHYAFPSVASFIEKHNRYSTWEARVREPYLAASSRTQGLAKHLLWRRRIKGWFRQLPMPDVSRFLFHYFFKLGFLDGKPGYVLCRLLAQYEFQIWAKTLESNLVEDSGGPSSLPSQDSPIAGSAKP